MCLVEVMLKELTGIFFFSTHSLYFHYYYYHRFLLSFLCVSFFLFFLCLASDYVDQYQTDRRGGR